MLLSPASLASTLGTGRPSGVKRYHGNADAAEGIRYPAPYHGDGEGSDTN